MSLLTHAWDDIFSRKMTFTQTVTDITPQFLAFEKAAGVDPAAVQATISQVKQSLSDAVAMADTKAAPIMQEAVNGVAAAAEAMTTALLARAGPIGIAAAAPLTAGEDYLIKQAYSMAHAVLLHLEAQVRGVPTPPVS